MIAYSSRTGNVKDIVRRLGLPSTEISERLEINRPFILFTYTDGLGNTPDTVLKFMKSEGNSENIRGVIASGNLNFGLSFCKCADEISKLYSVPIINKIDLRGSESDLEVIRNKYRKLIEVMD